MTKPTTTPAETPVGPFAALIGGWNRFWFSPADPTLLGFIRICGGLLTFYVVLAYTVDLQELFGTNAWVDARTINLFRYQVPFTGLPTGWESPRPQPAQTPEEAEYIRRFHIHPNQALAHGMPLWSVWFHVTDPSAMLVVHGIILGIIFLFTIGFCTRITSVLAWMGVLSYTHRAPTTLFGMDTMMNLVLIYLMIGPSGAALSVDRLIMRYWTTWRALRARRPAPAMLRPAPRITANLALRLIQVNLCFIYLISGLSKLEGKAWWNGTAIWGTMANKEFSPPIPFYWDALRYLAEHRMIWEISMTAGVVFTLATEIGFAFLIWNRSLRWIYLVMALVLHTGIAIFMGLNTFSLFMLVMLLAFVPMTTVHRLLAMLGRKAPPLRLEISTRSRRQVRVASLIRAVDAWDQVEVSTEGRGARGEGRGTDIAQAQLVDTSGEIRTGYALFEGLTQSLRLLRPLVLLTWIPGVAVLGKKWFPGAEKAPVSSSVAARPSPLKVGQ